jgi:hypothetical protein
MSIVLRFNLADAQQLADIIGNAPVQIEIIIDDEQLGQIENEGVGEIFPPGMPDPNKDRRRDQT